MLEYIFKTFKKLLGLNVVVVEKPSRKRCFHEDTRDDSELENFEEDELEHSVRKRRKLDPVPMADWVKTKKSFAEKYYFKTNNDSTFNDTNFGPARREIPDKRITPIRQRMAPLSSNSNLFHSSHEHLSRRPGHDFVSEMLQSDKGKKKNLQNRDKRHEISVANGKETDSSLTQSFNGGNAVHVNGNSHNSMKQNHNFCEHECSVHRKPLGFRNHIQTPLTVNQCIRLEEKEKYRQLLNLVTSTQQIPSNLTRSMSRKKISIHREPSKSSAHGEQTFARTNWLSKSKLSSAEQKRYKEQILSMSTKTPNENGNDTPDIEIIGFKKNVQTQRAGSSVAAKPKVAETEIPKWKQIGMSNGEFTYSSKWLTDWRKQLNADRLEKARQIEQAEKLAKKVSSPFWGDSFEELEANIREQLSIAEKQAEIVEEIFTIKDDEITKIEEDEVEPLPELTADMEEKIDDALRPNPPDEVLVEAFRLQIRRRDMETLQDLNWLNDEIINFYMNMLMERGKQSNMPSVYACNTFFYPKLLSGGHAALKRWTRKIDVFAHDIMLVPVHLGVHWCLAVVDFRKKIIKYFDSMGGKNNECLNALCNYLKAESLDKKKEKFEMKDWTLENVKDAPQQMNSSDCGMFACKYAEYITRKAKITFKQNQMPYFRRRMVYEILTAKLL